MNRQKLGQDTLQSLLIRIPVIILTFCYSIFLIKLLGPEGNGLFSFISASIGFSIIAFGFSVKKSTLFHIANNEFDTSKILGYSLSIHLIAILAVSFFLTVCFIFPSSLNDFFIPEGYFSLFYLIFFLVSFTLQFLTQLLRVVLLATKNFRSHNRYLLFSSIIQTVVYIGGFILIKKVGFDLTLIKLFSLILIVQVVISALIFYYFKVNYRGGISFKNRPIRKSFLTYASLTHFSQIGQFLNKRVDVWFVEFYNGLRSLGIYALASQFTNFLLEGISPIQEVLKTYLIGMKRKNGNLIFASFFKLVLYLTILAGTILFFISHPLVNMLFGDDFLEAVIPLRILCVGVIFIAIKRILLTYNSAYNDLKVNAIAQWSGVAVTILLDIVLIPKFGIIGAAIASTFSYLFSFLVIVVIFMYQQKIGLYALFIPTKMEVRDLAKYLSQAFSSGKER